MGQRANRTARLPKCTNASRRRLTYGEEPEDESVHWWPLTGIRSTACTGELSALYQDLVWSRSIQGLFIIVRWQWDVPRKWLRHRSATHLRNKRALTSKRQWDVRLGSLSARTTQREKPKNVGFTVFISLSKIWRNKSHINCLTQICSIF